MFGDNRFLSRDTNSLIQEIVTYIKAECPEITDFNESSVEMTLIEWFAGVCDMLSFYMDNQALETFLKTARQKKNIIGILETMNYPLPLTGSAIGEVRFFLEEPLMSTLLIPKYTQLSTATSPVVYYATTEDAYFNSTTLEVKCPVKQGKVTSIKVKSGELKKIRDFNYYLPRDPIADKSVIISQNNINWQEVEDAFLEFEGGAKYSVHKNADGSTYIHFTDNFDTYLPADNEEELVIKYLYSEGSAGNVDEFFISVINDALIDSDGETVRCLNVINDQKTLGGFDEVDLEKAKKLAKKNMVTMDRYITLEDYATAIAKEPYILKSVTYDWSVSESMYVKKPYQVHSWIVLNTGEEPGGELLDELEKKIYSKGICCNEVRIFPAKIRKAAIEVFVAVRGEVAFRENIRKEVEIALENKFRLENCNFGDRITKYDLRTFVHSISKNITKVEVGGLEQDIALSAIEFPRISVMPVRLIGDKYGQTDII